MEIFEWMKIIQIMSILASFCLDIFVYLSNQLKMVALNENGKTTGSSFKYLLIHYLEYHTFEVPFTLIFIMQMSLGPIVIITMVALYSLVHMRVVVV